MGVQRLFDSGVRAWERGQNKLSMLFASHPTPLGKARFYEGVITDFLNCRILAVESPAME